jgi:hypothetical protein
MPLRKKFNKIKPISALKCIAALGLIGSVAAQTNTCNNQVFYNGTNQQVTFDLSNWSGTVYPSVDWGTAGSGIDIPYMVYQGQKSVLSDWKGSINLGSTGVNLSAGDLKFAIRSAQTQTLKVTLKDINGKTTNPIVQTMTANQNLLFVAAPSLWATNGADLSKIVSIGLELPQVPAWKWMEIYFDNLILDCGVATNQSEQNPTTKINQVQYYPIIPIDSARVTYFASTSWKKVPADPENLILMNDPIIASKLTTHFLIPLTLHNQLLRAQEPPRGGNGVIERWKQNLHSLYRYANKNIYADFNRIFDEANKFTEFASTRDTSVAVVLMSSFQYQYVNSELLEADNILSQEQYDALYLKHIQNNPLVTDTYVHSLISRNHFGTNDIQLLINSNFILGDMLEVPTFSIEVNGVTVPIDSNGIVHLHLENGSHAVKITTTVDQKNYDSYSFIVVGDR